MEKMGAMTVPLKCHLLTVQTLPDETFPFALVDVSISVALYMVLMLYNFYSTVLYYWPIYFSDIGITKTTNIILAVIGDILTVIISYYVIQVVKGARFTVQGLTNS